MSLLIIVIVLLLLFGGGWGGYRTWGAPGGLGIVGVELLLVWLMGGLRLYVALKFTQ
jgi:hypothetical protein